MNNDRLARGYLQWRCRRGTKELDVILTTFLDAHYESLSDQELNEFNELLDTQDTILWYWLSGQQSAKQTPLANIVDKIHAHNH